MSACGSAPRRRKTPGEEGSTRIIIDKSVSINPLETLIATRDIMADFGAGTQRIVHARYGESAGNRIEMTVPAALYTGQTPGDRSGLATIEVPFSAVGRDAGAFLCFY